MIPPSNLDQQLKALLLKDLREQLRARGQNPGGGMEDLRERLKEHMVSSGDYRLNVSVDVNMPAGAPAAPSAQQGSSFGGGNAGGNNYSRPSGMQNVGNFISDRPTSRVLAPPGGGSQISFGGPDVATPAKATPAPAAQGQPKPQSVTPPPASSPATSSQMYGSGSKDEVEGHLKNNYSRPSGAQNVGNFITGRPSSKVLAPPGGKSQISFG